jgi:hypothetical protein
MEQIHCNYKLSRIHHNRKSSQWSVPDNTIELRKSIQFYYSKRVTRVKQNTSVSSDDVEPSPDFKDHGSSPSGFLLAAEPLLLCVPCVCLAILT